MNDTSPNDSFPRPGLDLPTGQPSSPEPPAPTPRRWRDQVVAPVWHTVLIVMIIVANSYLSSATLSHTVQSRGRVLLYLSTIVWQLVLVGIVWIGLRLRKKTLRELIGGRWNTKGDFWRDVAIAAGFWIVSLFVLAALKIALGLGSLDAKQSAEQVKQTIGPISPRSGVELAVFLLLVLFAGLCEEIIFRGYLQRQFAAFTRNVFAGVAIAAIIFGGGHGYQGGRQMILLAIYGAWFGLLVVWRKSLRPAMMAHAWQDAFSGIVVFVLTKMGMM